MPLRPATSSDFPRILALNHASVQYLSALTPERLALLHGQAALHWVVEDDAGAVAAFLLAFREGSAYDSVNYRWFAERHARFLYIDRVVVDASARGTGAGTLLYRAVFDHAAQQGVPLITLEIDSDPPNPVSERFHDRFGFREVGRQRVPYAPKEVSLRIASVPTPAR